MDNFSSEANDTLDFISTFFSGKEPPPLLRNFDATKCGVTFISNISQLDADQQAQSAAITCNNPGLFTNTPQTFCVTCPSGTQSCYTVPAGLITGASQAEADSAALLMAETLVNRNLVCFSNIDQCTCINTPYSAIITSVVPVLWSVTNGSLPPGITFNGSLTIGSISGTPTVAGTYAFQITGISAEGPIGVHTFIIVVLEITTTNLPPFTVGTPYTAQLNATGGSGNYNWKLTSGTLPPGLTLSSSGLISGTPTGSGTNPLVFQVIDLACEAADESFFPPRVVMSTKSTTTIATILGYPEYIASTPPKKYHKLTWSGEALQTMQTAATNQFIGGAKFVWNGTGEIDSKGNQISNYQKLFFAACPKLGPWPPVISTPNFGLISLTGFCWPPEPGSCPTCDPNDLNWNLVGDLQNNRIQDSAQAGLNNLLIDTSKRVFTSTSLDDSATGTFEVSALGDVTTVPLTTLNGIFAPWVKVLSTNTCKSQLSDEYTDAEALANALVIVSNGTTAENFQRTTGYVTRTTNVVFTLALSNLIIGRKYLVKVNFFDSHFSSTTKQYSITASQTSTSIIDIIPTPPAGGTITVLNPSIVFSP